MGCACKVGKQIDKIHKQYGTIPPTVKTNIKEKILIFFKKILISIILIPLYPVIFLYLIIRGFITNKPISISRFIKKKNDVRI